jgi:hypothetical protein
VAILLANLNMPFSRLISDDTEMDMNRGLRLFDHELRTKESRTFTQLISFASSCSVEMCIIDGSSKVLKVF